VAAFDRDAESRQDLDFRLMVNTFVVLFWRMATLDQTIGWLQDHGYDVVSVDASTWTAEDDFHRDIAGALALPDYYGRNLDALNDCLCAIAAYDYTSSPKAAGFVLVVTGYERFTTHCPSVAHALLDIFAIQARAAALIGHRMLCLVQSNDPDIGLGPVGATPVMWNDAEWLDANRRR
jgi:hypothetical protein